MKNWKTYIPFIVGLPLLYFLPRAETPGWVGNVLYGFVGLLLLLGVIVLGWAISRKVKFGPIITTIQGLVPSGGGSIWPKALLILIFILMHVTIWWTWWTWWHDNLWSIWSLIAHIGFALGFLALIRGPKAKPAQHLFGLILIFLTSLLVLNETGIVRMGEKWPAGSGVFPPSWSMWASGATPKSSTSGQSVYVRTSATIPRGDTKYPRTETWPDKEVAEKTMRGQWDLLAACYRESGLTHIDPDTGKPRVYQNTNGSIDTGICQINSVHDEELKRLKLDKTKLRDNLVFAMILYNKEGLKPWTPRIGEKLVFEFEVTTQWSNTFRLPQYDYADRHFTARFDPKVEPVHIALNNEKVITVLEPAPKFTDLNLARPIMNYKFKLLPDKTKEELMTVTYQF